MRTDRDPLNELALMHKRLNEAIESFLSGRPQPRGQSSSYTPPADVIKTDDCLIIRVELPGSCRDDISLEARKGVLELAGSRRCAAGAAGGRFTRLEGSYGSFLRRFALPDDADVDNVEASLSAGVLEIQVPLAGAGNE